MLICTIYIFLFGWALLVLTVVSALIVRPVCGRWKAKEQERRNRRAVKALQSNLQECIKHYVRVLEKTPKPAEAIYEIKNNKKQSFKYSGGEHVYKAKIPKKGDSVMLVSGKKKITLSKDGTPENLENGVRLIYVYIKVYVKKKGFIKRLFDR